MGAIVLLLCITGTLLMYEKQMIAWADRAVAKTSAIPWDKRLPLETLLAAASEKSGRAPESVTLRAEPGSAVEVSFGKAGLFYVDPGTGVVLGKGERTARELFQTLKEWHRWLGKNTPATKAVTGAANLAFVFIIGSGLFLWLPRQWRWQNVRAVMLFRGGLAGKARNFNWHNVMGIWCAVPLLAMAVTGVFFSYPWATNLLYRATGETPPARPAGRPASTGDAPLKSINLQGWNTLQDLAVKQAPDYQTIVLRVNSPANASAAIERGPWGRVDLRSQLTINPETAQVLKAESFADQSPARRIRSWVRTIHTGEAGGLLGQTIAGVTSLGGGVLVWTGLALSWARFRAWRAARDRTRRPATLQS